MHPKIGSGDDGETSLLSGKRVSKNDDRIEAVGTIDELQSLIGMVLSLELEDHSRHLLTVIPHLLYEIAAEVAGDGKFMARNVNEEESKKMEEWIFFLDEKMPPLRAFILPGGAVSAQWLNLARTVARRVERRMYVLFAAKKLRPEIFQFLNRLSLLFFCLERWENFRKGGEEKKWKEEEKFPALPN